MPRLTIFAALAFLAGCYPARPALQKQPTNNDAFKIDYLFTHDGCRVYRFIDVGPHYFVRCDGPAPEQPQASATTLVSCGKSCTQEERVPTAHAR